MQFLGETGAALCYHRLAMMRQSNQRLSYDYYYYYKLFTFLSIEDLIDVQCLLVYEICTIPYNLHENRAMTDQRAHFVSGIMIEIL